jgi:hypothetical protein
MKQCDLVMRGGLTSGIIYPKAIVCLATQYQFRQVGGASAGAIAAELAATAELNRAGGWLRSAVHGVRWIRSRSREFVSNVTLRDIRESSNSIRPHFRKTASRRRVPNCSYCGIRAKVGCTCRVVGRSRPFDGLRARRSPEHSY